MRLGLKSKNKETKIKMLPKNGAKVSRDKRELTQVPRIAPGRDAAAKATPDG